MKNSGYQFPIFNFSSFNYNFTLAGVVSKTWEPKTDLKIDISDENNSNNWKSFEYHFKFPV